MKLWPLLALLIPSLATAQTLTLGSEPPPLQTCTSVTIDGVTSYGCHTPDQPALRAQHQANLATTTPNATSSPTQLGLYNQAAMREHFGTAYGKSTHPQYTPPPSYIPKLGPH